jgi:hypothetical protein
MAKEEYNLHSNPWYTKDNIKKCSCKQCTPDGCKGCKCEPLTKHPSFQTPVVTVEEAIEIYRKAKVDQLTAKEALRKAKAKVFELEQKVNDAINEEFRAELTLKRAFSDEAKNNG